MGGAEMLVYGKALMFFAIPLALAFWELRRLRAERRAGAGGSDQPCSRR